MQHRSAGFSVDRLFLRILIKQSINKGELRWQKLCGSNLAHKSGGSQAPPPPQKASLSRQCQYRVNVFPTTYKAFVLYPCRGCKGWRWFSYGTPYQIAIGYLAPCWSEASAGSQQLSLSQVCSEKECEKDLLDSPKRFNNCLLQVHAANTTVMYTCIVNSHMAP